MRNPGDGSRQGGDSFSFSTLVSKDASRRSMGLTIRPPTAPMCATTFTSRISRTSHVVAEQALENDVMLQPDYNLGGGDGVAVAEIMSAVSRVTGMGFTPTIGPRRAGDPARIVASGALAARDISWKMRHSLDEMAASAWQARLNKPADIG